MTRDTGWFKTSHSSPANDNCVEIRITGEVVGVRDSKAPVSGTLQVSSAAWATFLARASN
ncbi:DUF397 domain-containing protein [Amycolatopsis minnesotensis]|uniref:DUF397 domain-containing protein n=1 Tax=Amycolatopsis minnesotensis TaxID=337894 RepID=A0ABN2SD87_9PSEU